MACGCKVVFDGCCYHSLQLLSGSSLSSIGIDFSSWTEDTELLSDAHEGGVVFWMNPDRASTAIVGDFPDRTVVVAQLTISSTETSHSAHFGPQGWSANDGDDWEENCISVKVGGPLNGQGSHAYHQPGSDGISTHAPSPPAVRSSSLRPVW